MQDLKNELYKYVMDSPQLYSQIIETIAVIFVFGFIRFLVLRILARRIKDEKLRYKWRKNLSYISSFVAFLIIGQIWIAGVKSLATFLGLLAAGLTIALREPVTSLAGWIFLIWRKPFDMGDRIQIGEHKGDVIDIRIFKFTILEIGNWVDADQSTGRVIHIPNHRVFSENIANYTSDFEFLWDELRVPLTFESNWKKAKKILTEIVEKHLLDFVDEAKRQVKRASNSYLIHYKYLTPIVYTEVKENGIVLTIRYLINPRKRRTTAQDLWEDILVEFNREDDIEFGYKTFRIYDHISEGKPGVIHPHRPPSTSE